MQIQYQRTLEDYKEVLAAQGVKPLRQKVLRAIAWCLLNVLGAFVLVSLGLREGRAFAFMLLAWFVVCLVIFTIRPLWIKRDFIGHPNFSRPQTVQVDESGVSFESAIGKSETKWGAYIRSQETQNLFLLYLGARLVEAVPKRAFSTEQLDEFRELTQKKVQGNSRIPKKGAHVLPRLPH